MREHASPAGEAGRISMEELQLATRNHGMPLEALAQSITPVGLHYLLIHYDIAFLDPHVWRLDLSGRFNKPRNISLDELRARPRVSTVVTMECAGNGRAGFDPRPLSQPWLHEAVGTAEWTGTPLKPLLEEAGISDNAVEIVFTGADQGLEGGEEQTFARALSVADASRPEVLLAYEMNGALLPAQHGAPVRLVCPGWYGMTNVKWLTQIEAIDRPFDGYQQRQAYRLRESETDPGTPLTHILPRTLMRPPGIPDFFTRRRLLDMRETVLEGRAWSGFGPIAAVEVSTDGGRSWSAAELARPDLGPWAWQHWQFRWQPDDPGDYLLACRARDAAGTEHQSLNDWNVGGYASSKPHTIEVTVRQ